MPGGRVAPGRAAPAEQRTTPAEQAEVSEATAVAERTQPAPGRGEPSAERHPAAARLGPAPEPDRAARQPRPGHPSVRGAGASRRRPDREDHRRPLRALHADRRDGRQHAAGAPRARGPSRAFSRCSTARPEAARSSSSSSPGSPRTRRPTWTCSSSCTSACSSASRGGTGSSRAASASSRRSGSGCCRSSESSAASTSVICPPNWQGIAAGAQARLGWMPLWVVGAVDGAAPRRRSTSASS